MTRTPEDVAKSEPNDFPLPHASFDLTGQVALVTGATAGLGRRFARVLAAAGAAVGVAGRRVELIAEVVAEIEADGGRAYGVPLDVRDADAITRAVAATEEELGLVTILVNNAGIPDAQRPHKISVDLLDRVLDTNVRGPWLLSTEVARRLIHTGTAGRIVNLSSMAAHHYDGNASALYSVSKAAVSRMTEVLAVEWARHHINVNAISPGMFRSEMMQGMVDRVGDVAQTFPRQRYGDPAQLDSTLLYLVSPASDAVTGTVIRVDDGQIHR